MRTIECLVRQYPEKTGNEILVLQKEDREKDEKDFQILNKKNLDMVDDINKNGGYYKGTFGLDQYYYYSFSNMLIIDDGTIYCDVDSIVCFDSNLSIKQEFNTWRVFDRYGIHNETRIEKEEYDALSNYIRNTFSKFWTPINKENFK